MMSSSSKECQIYVLKTSNLRDASIKRAISLPAGDKITSETQNNEMELMGTILLNQYSWLPGKPT